MVFKHREDWKKRGMEEIEELLQDYTGELEKEHEINYMEMQR